MSGKRVDVGFCAATEVGGMESLVASRIDSVFFSKKSERTSGGMLGSVSAGGVRIEFRDFQSVLPSHSASSIVRRR